MAEDTSKGFRDLTKTLQESNKIEALNLEMQKKLLAEQHENAKKEDAHRKVVEKQFVDLNTSLS